MYLNIDNHMATYQPPIAHNSSLNTVFNTTDFSQSNTSPYLPITGGTMTGSLNGISAAFTGSVSSNSFTTGTFLNLPATYSSAPSSNQLGATTSQALTTNPVTGFNTLGTLTLSAPGSYLLLLNVYLTPSAIINNYIVSIGDSTTSTHDFTSAVQCATANGTTGSVLCVQVSKIVSNTSTKSYKAFGTFTLSGGTTTISNSSLTAIRLG